MNSMINQLNEGYTLYFGYDRDGKVQGGYLKKVDRYMQPSSLQGDEESFIEMFPHILDSLRNGKMLQMYYGDGPYMYTAMLGDKILEGPYGEDECLDQVVVANDFHAILTLRELDNILENSMERPVVYQKAYRLYGSDKYQFYTREFIKKNMGDSQ